MKPQDHPHPQPMKTPECAPGQRLSVQTGSGTHLACYSMGMEPLIPGVKCLRHEVDHSRLILNGAIYLHGMHRDNFTYSALHLPGLHMPYHLFRQDLNQM